MADLTPRCVVALIVALALSGPIQNLSAKVCADTLECLSDDTNVLRSGTSSVRLSTCDIRLIIHSFKSVSDGSMEWSNASSDSGSEYIHLVVLP